MAAAEKAWTIGCCASLVAHAALTWWGLRTYVRETDVGLRYAAPAWQLTKAQEWVDIEPVADTLKEPEPPRAILPEPPEIIRYTRFGEAEGKGQAANSAMGEQLLQAMLGQQEQAWLSRDPVGPGRLPDEPSESIARRGDGGAGGRVGSPGEGGRGGMFGVPPAPTMAPRIVKRPAALVEIEKARAEVLAAAPKTDPLANLIGIAEGGALPSAPATRPIELARAEKRIDAQKAIEGQDEGVERKRKADKASTPPAPAVPDVPEVTQVKTGQMTAAASGQGGNAGGGAGVPGARAEEADPAPQGDSESDAFSSKGTVIVTAGKIDARLGRDVKPVKPRLRIKAGLDVYSIADSSVTMLVKIDAAGKVTDVKIVKSSGSNDIDLPTVVAMYKWWIEPAKDKEGKAVADAIHVTIHFR